MWILTSGLSSEQKSSDQTSTELPSAGKGRGERLLEQPRCIWRVLSPTQKKSMEFSGSHMSSDLCVMLCFS